MDEHKRVVKDNYVQLEPSSREEVRSIRARSNYTSGVGRLPTSLSFCSFSFRLAPLYLHCLCVLAIECESVDRLHRFFTNIRSITLIYKSIILCVRDTIHFCLLLVKKKKNRRAFLKSAEYLRFLHSGIQNFFFDKCEIAMLVEKCTFAFGMLDNI